MTKEEEETQKKFVTPYEPFLRIVRGDKPTADDWIRYLHCDEVRRMSDNALETERIYLMREIVELKQKKLTTHYYMVLLGLCEGEIKRRMELAEHGAPAYKGRGKTDFVSVADLKRYYTGEAFVNLFVNVTGFEVIFQGGKYKYRCPLHGEDKHPSGVLYEDDGRWWCYGCNKGGDIFSLLNMFPPYLNFTDALKQLTEWAYPYREVEAGKFKKKK